MAREDDTADAGGVVLDNAGGVVVLDVQDQGTDQGADQGGAPDDGLSDEDRAAFVAMRTGEAGPVDGAEPGVDALGAKKEGAAEEGADGADGDDEGGDGADGTNGEAAEGDKRRKRVGWSTHQRELRLRDEKIAALEAANKTNNEMQARLDERMKIINEALTPKEKAELTEDDPEPDPDSEIFEHNKWLRRQLGKTNEALRQLNDGLTQQNQQTEVERAYVQDFHTYTAQQPAFPAAYNYMLVSRMTEIALNNFGKDIAPGADGQAADKLTPNEAARIKAMVESEEMELVSSAIRQNKSPAERIFKFAWARGFRPQAAAAAEAGGKTNGAEGGKKNGHAPGSLAAEAEAVDSAGGAGANGKGSVREEVRRIQRGVEASASLSSGGGAPARTITPQMIANMDQDEFNDLVTRLGGTDSLAVKQLLGGA